MSNEEVFPGSDVGNFWTSTPYANYSGSAWVISFSMGGVSGVGKDSAAFVRLVRAGM